MQRPTGTTPTGGGAARRKRPARRGENGSPWDVATLVPAESLREQPIGPGTLLGRYRTLEQLGAGGMGDTNGFRCVRNLDMVPAAATLPIHHVTRNFENTSLSVTK